MRQIAETLSQKTPTMQSWKLRDAWDDVDLKGDPIVLPNDARLIFLNTYLRHVCPLYVAVFLQLQDISKSPLSLAGLSIGDLFGIMRIHAA